MITKVLSGRGERFFARGDAYGVMAILQGRGLFGSAAFCASTSDVELEWVAAENDAHAGVRGTPSPKPSKIKYDDDALDALAVPPRAVQGAVPGRRSGARAF